MAMNTKKIKDLESSQSQKRLDESKLEGASKCKQTKLSFSGNEGMTWDQNDARALKCHILVLKYLIWDMIPYNEVTNAGFMQLINTLNPKFKVGSDKLYRAMLDTQYDVCKNKVSNKIEKTILKIRELL